MSLPKSITIAQQATAIQAHLQDWATQFGGKVVIVSNLRDLWSYTNIRSDAPRILICFNGENSRGSFSQLVAWHRVDREWLVVVTKGRGYFANRGDSLNNPNVVELPFYDAIEQVRDQWRCMLGISEELPTIDYRGTKAMQLGNLVMDGYMLTATTANDIPAIGTTPN